MDKTLVIIATDGSAKKAGTGFDCASGCCVYTPQDRNVIVNFEKLDDDATVSVAEITGVLLGLKAISGMDKSKYDFVFLIDSEYIQKSVTVWYPGWIKRMKEDGIPRTSSGQPVKHFDKIQKAFKKLSGIGAKIFKIRSHIPENKMEETHKEFCKINKIDISFDMYKIFVECNKICDATVESRSLETPFDMSNNLMDMYDMYNKKFEKD